MWKDKTPLPPPPKKLLKSQVINDLITLLFNISLHNINSNLKKTSKKNHSSFSFTFLFIFLNYVPVISVLKNGLHSQIR